MNKLVNSKLSIIFRLLFNILFYVIGHNSEFYFSFSFSIFHRIKNQIVVKMKKINKKTIEKTFTLENGTELYIFQFIQTHLYFIST